MKKPLVTIVISILFIGLIANNYRLHKAIEETKAIPIDNKSEELTYAIERMQSRENELLEQNAMLLIQINDLKFELEKKPITIIKKSKNETLPINDNASEHITNILSKRYIPE